MNLSKIPEHTDERKIKETNKMDVKLIVEYASYIVAGLTVISLVSTNPVHALLLGASAGAYFVAKKVL